MAIDLGICTDYQSLFAFSSLLSYAHENHLISQYRHSKC